MLTTQTCHIVLYYQGVKLYSPITSAVAVLPETLTVAPSGMIVGIIAGVTGKYRWSLWSGWVITTLGSGLLYLLQPETTVAQWIWLNIPIGIGTGMLFPAMGLSIQAACDPSLNGEAAAFFSFLRTFGQSIGVAISGVIFQNAFRDKLLALPAYTAMADHYSRDATIVVDIINHMPEGEARSQLMQAYADALRLIWISMIAFSGFCMILSFTTKSYSLQQEHVTKQRLIVAEKKDQSDIESGEKTDGSTSN
jgi:MFS family permease